MSEPKVGVSVVNDSALGMEKVFSYGDRTGLRSTSLSGEYGTSTVDKSALSGLIATNFLEDNPGEELKGIGRYKASVWIHAASSAISRNLAKVPLKISRKLSDGSFEDVDDEVIQGAIERSIGQLDEDHFIESAALYIALAGSGPIEAVRVTEAPMDTTSDIDRFRPIMPSRLRAVPGEKRGDPFITKFVAYDSRGNPTDIAPENIAFPRLPDPDSPFVGLAPVTVLARTAANEERAEEYNGELLDNSGSPNVYKHVGEHPLDPPTVRKAEHDLTRKMIQSNGKVIVLPHNMEPAGNSMAPKDLQWIEMMGVSKDKILAVYGTPPLMVMDLTDSSLLQNTTQQRVVFRTQTLEYYSEKILRSLNRIIVPQYGVYIRHAWEQVSDNMSVIERREQARLDYSAGIASRNEVRVAGAEFDPIEGEAGEEFATDVAAAQSSPFALTLSRSARQESKIPFSAEAKRFAAANARKQQNEQEPKILREVRVAFREQAERVIEAFRKNQQQLELLGEKSRHTKTPIFPGDLLSELFDTVAEARSFRDQLGPVFLGGITTAGEDKLATHLDGGLIQAIQAGTDRYRQAFDSVVGRDIQRITETTRRQVVATIERGFDQGLGSQGVIGELSKLFQGYEEGGISSVSRAERIARTETTTILNAGAHAATMAVEDSGGQFVKSWLSFRDRLVRDDHESMDARYSANPIPLKTAFEAPDGSSLMYPGDPAAPASQRANCRCTQIERLVKQPSAESIL